MEENIRKVVQGSSELFKTRKLPAQARLKHACSKMIKIRSWLLLKLQYFWIILANFDFFTLTNQVHILELSNMVRCSCHMSIFQKQGTGQNYCFSIALLTLEEFFYFMAIPFLQKKSVGNYVVGTYVPISLIILQKNKLLLKIWTWRIINISCGIYYNDFLLRWYFLPHGTCLAW